MPPAAAPLAAQKESAPANVAVMRLGGATTEKPGDPLTSLFGGGQVVVFKDLLELGYYASDNLLPAVVSDDSLAELVVGCFPAR